MSIAPNPIGEVNTGWGVTPGDYNPAIIENVGGIPNITYELWEATEENPNQDTMSLRLSIPLSQLDGNPDILNSIIAAGTAEGEP